ncbi:hypothetical protein [Sphaerisporangium aureirubrum]|uniref:DUF222 domain-containing protein n=1 Tax=Sphaerisporangium aureirubrum TaxID=1544736 RepID=A0ABW1NCQ2_9ACTN
MYYNVTPREFESTPVTGALSADAPSVSVTVRLELTQEEAAGVLVGLSLLSRYEGDPRITPADTRRMLTQVITDVTLHTIRQAARYAAEAEEICPEDAGWHRWCRRLIAPLASRQATKTARTLTGTAVA